MKKIILNRTGKVDSIIEMADEIETTRAGKRKFIAREMEE